MPVISTNAGGLPEINVNGYSGYMSDIGDVEDMAANAVKVLENDETHRKFKKQALAQAKKFDIQHIIPTYEAMYTRLLETSTAS